MCVCVCVCVCFFYTCTNTKCNPAFDEKKYGKACHRTFVKVMVGILLEEKEERERQKYIELQTHGDETKKRSVEYIL